MSTRITRDLSLYLLLLLALGLALAGCGSPAATPAAAPTQAVAAATETPVPPTATPVPPSATPQPTDTPVPPTATPTLTATNTPVPPSATPEPAEAPATAEPVQAASPAETHLEQGITYFKAEKWAEAIAELEEAIRLDPELGVAYAWLGYAYLSKGPEEFAKAVPILEKYLQLVPDAEDKAQVEADLKQVKEYLASAAPAYDVPAGKALFVFTNYTDKDWSIDVGSYHLDLPAWTGGDYPVGQVVIEPGKYTWQAMSPGGGFYITDGNGNKSFEFTVAAGEVHAEAVGGPPR